MLGAFALVGLQVTGPDTRATGEHYLNDLNVADLAIIGSLGIDQDDQQLIDQAKGASDIEYGYLKDAVVTDTTDSFRLFSRAKDDDISQYEIRSGRLPEKTDEIAISAEYQDRYQIGDVIKFDETADASGQKVLKKPEYKIVGFIYSGEILSSNNLGASTAGTGSLKGYGVLTPEAFDSEVYMIARLRFDDLKSIDPYSQDYTNKLQAHKDDLNHILKDQPEHRLQAVKNEYQEKIADGQKQIDDAKKKLADTEQQLKNAKQQLDEGSQKISAAEKTLNDQVSAAQQQINDGSSQLNSAEQQMASSDQLLKDAKQQLDAGANTLTDRWNQLESGKQALAQAKQQLNQANQKLQAGADAIAAGKAQIANGYRELIKNQDALTEADKQIKTADQKLQVGQKQLADQKAAYDQSKATYDEKAATYQANEKQWQDAQATVDQNKAKLEQAKAKYDQTISELEAKEHTLNEELKKPDLSETDKQTLTEQLKQVTAQKEKATAERETFLTETYQSGIASIKELQAKLTAQKAELDAAKAELDQAKEKLDDANAKIQAGEQTLAKQTELLNQKKAEFSEKQKAFNAAKEKLEAGEKELQKQETTYQASLTQYNAKVGEYNAQYATYTEGLAAWQQGAKELDTKSKEYQANAEKLAQAKQTLATKAKELQTAKDTLAEKQADGEKQIADSKATLTEKQAEYDKNAKAFADKKDDAQKEIDDKQNELNEAKERLDNLALPTYSLNSRREIPGGEGTQIYTNIGTIVDALANVFPIFLYFVAALVAFTTMGRFVDEERINAGTLKALGYDDFDVFKKFAFYGLTAGLIGTTIGVILGHTLIPSIAYNAYKVGFTLPKIEWHFHPGITVIAFIASLISSVLPAWIATKRELAEKPAQLLLPKPPTSGSKIFLERLTPIWERMSFTHKVTARNIFRYKQRMLMTIFGVAGAVSLLFAGLAVQDSIGGINERQFGEIIHYDVIVAQNDYVSDQEEKDIMARLNGDTVKEYAPIHYEELTKVAGAKKDKQSIKLIVPKDTKALSDYISLRNRKSQAPIDLPDDGIILSERFAQLVNVKVGDSLTVMDAEDQERTVKVAGIAEMYMGHFAFMSPTAYEKAFAKDFTGNAHMVQLNDHSQDNVEKQAAEFMKYSGVINVVQNTVFTNMIDTIVKALNKILKVLIIIAALLAIVILYNLTNINVSERMRELSTIKVLGFYDKEVTQYIYRETFLLTLVGIVVGFGIGELLHLYIIKVVPPEEVMFDPSLTMHTFILPAVIIIIITAILAIVIHERLKNVDMLEALSSVE